ncbi:unnamed protein product, partial [marine sediment metagenome]
TKDYLSSCYSLTPNLMGCPQSPPGGAQPLY